MKIKMFFLFLFIFFWCCPAQPAVAQKDPLAQIQAAYLVNFIRYTFWQDKKEGQPLRIVIFSPDVFQALKEAPSLTAHKRKLEFYEIRKENIDFSEADVIFIAKNMLPLISDSVMEKIPRTVLIVSDSPQIFEKGGTIELKIIDNKLRFSINISRLSGMTISANLLRMAVEVIR